MARILGLDIGKSRIGVAVSDQTQTIATALDKLITGSAGSTIKKIGDIAAQHKAGSIVVGLPLNMNGSKGQAAQAALDFADRIKKALNIPVFTYDERLTTKEAEHILLEADMSRKKRRENIDSLAAVIMLQAYLDSRRQKG